MSIINCQLLTAGGELWPTRKHRRFLYATVLPAGSKAGALAALPFHARRDTPPGVSEAYPSHPSPGGHFAQLRITNYKWAAAIRRINFVDMPSARYFCRWQNRYNSASQNFDMLPDGNAYRYKSPLAPQGERWERCQRQMKRPERVAAVGERGSRSVGNEGTGHRNRRMRSIYRWP